MNRVNVGATVAVRGLSIRYGGGRSTVLAVDQASFEIAPGSRTALVGPAGSGKRAILQAVSGFLRASEGEVLVDGAPAASPSPDRFVVWRDPEQLLPWKSVLANVEYAVACARLPDARERARVFLNRAGLGRALSHYPHELSPALKIRAAVARAFACRPRILLLEDPFSLLDSHAREKLQDLVVELQEESGITLLLGTRDPAEAVRLGRSVVALSARPGRVAGVFQPSAASAAITAQEIRSLVFGDGEGS